MPEKHEANLIEILLARNEYAFWNIADFAKRERCRTINTITWGMGELKKTSIVYLFHESIQSYLP